MEMTDIRNSKSSNQHVVQDSKLSFENTEIAFSSKSDKNLRNAYWLFKLIANNFLMACGKHGTRAVLALHLPVKGLIKATIFKQFCGGETIAECAQTTKTLDKYNVGTILDYSVEGKGNESDFKAAFEELSKTVVTAHGNAHIPFCVFKMTGLCSHELLEKLSLGKPLNADEEAAKNLLETRVDDLCRKAYDTGTPIFIDAEESWIQPAIDDLAMRMIFKYNKERAVVYNTLQMYRHDRLEHLKEAHEACTQKAAVYAVKIVRGAYMEKERERAEDMGYQDPIQVDKSSTDRDFNAAILYCLDHLEKIALCAGTHNEESSKLLANEMAKRGIPKNHKHAYFAQLFGMSDHISFNLSNTGHNVAKYVPYGPVREVMPYLIRRAEENTSVAGQTGRELKLIISEMKRRKAANSHS